jgi:hypothetical protein
MGRTANTQSYIIKDILDNVNFIGLNVSAVVASDGLVNFTPSDNVSNIIGTPILNVSPAFTTYDIDFDNDTIYDSSNNDASTFSNTYSTLTSVISGNNKKATLSLTESTNSLILGDIYTEVSFEAVNTLPQDVIINNINCNTLEAYSPSVNYLNKLVGYGGIDNSDMSTLEVTIDQNCCNVQTVFNLYPSYNFELTNLNSCTATVNQLTVGGFLYDIYTMPLQITGIDSSLVKNVKFTKGANSNTTLVDNGTSLTIVPEYLLDNPFPSGHPLIVENKQIIITTTKDYVYIINFTITPDNVLATCTGESLTSIVYPDYPEGILVKQDALRATYIEISSDIYSYVVNNESLFFDGIYTISLSENAQSSTTVSGCKFIDCQTNCLILKALVNDCDPVISILYDALLQINNCSGISCNNLCDTYAYLESLLNECDCSILQNNSISSSSDCGCK